MSYKQALRIAELEAALRAERQRCIDICRRVATEWSLPELWAVEQCIKELERDAPAPQTPVAAISKLLAEAIGRAVLNGANSVSMPDEYVEIAAWLAALQGKKS